MRPSTPTERVVAFLCDPGRRFRGLVILAYGAAVAGLCISLLPGPLSAGDGRLTLGIALMFFAFVILFYLSITVVESHGDSHSR